MKILLGILAYLCVGFVVTCLVKRGQKGNFSEFSVAVLIWPLCVAVMAAVGTLAVVGRMLTPVERFFKDAKPKLDRFVERQCEPRAPRKEDVGEAWMDGDDYDNPWRDETYDDYANEY